MRERIKHMVKSRKRYTAAAMTAILVSTAVFNNTGIATLAAQSNNTSVVFELSADELKEYAEDAMESGVVFESVDLFETDLPEAYDRLFHAENGWNIYEFTPDIENNVSDKAELRTFVYARDNASRLSDDAEIVFLFVNHGRAALDFAVSVDGHVTTPVSVEGLSAATASNATASNLDDRYASDEYDDDDNDDEYDFEIELINDLDMEDDSDAMSVSGSLSGVVMDSVLLADGSHARALRMNAKELRKVDAVNSDYPAFHPESIVIDDVIITLSAPAGVIPAGTTVSVIPVAQDELSDLMGEVQTQDEAGTYSEDEVSVPVVLNRIGFDISLYDAEGSPLTFDEGVVTVSFRGTPIEEMTRDANTVTISHVDFETNTVENIMSSEFPAEEALEQVDFEAEHFSTYVLETGLKNESRKSSPLDGTELAVGLAVNITQRAVWENGQTSIAYCHNYNQASPGGYTSDKLNQLLDNGSPVFTSATDTLTPSAGYSDIQLTDNRNTRSVKKVTVNRSGAALQYENPLYFKHSYEDLIENSDWIFDYDSTVDAKDNIDKIMNLLYAGYPYDSFGLAKQYQVQDIQAYTMTQSLFWYLCNENAENYAGYPVSYIKAILNNDSPTTDFERYTKSLYDAISNENCRNPRLYLSGDTTMTTDGNNYYQSGLISTYSGFGGTFTFTSVPEGYEIHREDGTAVIPGDDGTRLSAGDSFYITTENPVLAEDDTQIVLTINYAHTASTLTYYRYINKEMSDHNINMDAYGVRSTANNQDSVNKATNAYQDLVRLELLNETTEIPLSATLVPGKPPVIDPIDPDPVDPDPVDPDPIEPGPVDPDPVDPSPVDPDPIEPGPVDPDPVEPGPVDPDPIEPGPVDPDPVEPGPVDPTTPPDDTNNNSNGNGSGGGGGGSNGSSTSNGVIVAGDSPAGPITITEEPVPMAALPAGPETPLTNIGDEPVPLAPLPKTGQSPEHTLPLMALSGMLLAFIELWNRKKHNDNQ